MSKETGHGEPSGGQLVTSTTVRFRERWSWAWHRVEASDFSQSVGAAALAGVLVVIAAPQAPEAVAWMAAIGGASLMFGGQLVANLYKARPEILARRLTAADKRITQLEDGKDRQDAIDDLARKYQEGVVIKNDRVLSAAEWSLRCQGWLQATTRLLDGRFSSAEASLFRASEPRNVPAGRKDVARDLAGLNGQLQVLNKIIGSGRAE